MPAPTVLVTGASSGIGAATARLLLERGWRVFAAARRLEAMEPLAALGAEVMALDLSDEHSRRELAEQLTAKVGALDALVNNAGFGEDWSARDIAPGSSPGDFRSQRRLG